MDCSFCSQYKKRSAVEGLIEIQNPNRVSNKNKKATEVDVNAATVLSRRERWVCGVTHAWGVTLQQMALVLHLWKSNQAIRRIFGGAAMCKWGEALGLTFMLRSHSRHQGGDREAEIKGAHPEAPKWREDWAGQGWPGQTGHHQETEGGGCQEERSTHERWEVYNSKRGHKAFALQHWIIINCIGVILIFWYILNTTLFFCQKKKLKKPKENTNYLCRHSVMHLSLEAMGRGPIQVASHQEPILNFRTSLLKYKNKGFSWWQIPLWKKSIKSRNATCRVN